MPLKVASLVLIALSLSACGGGGSSAPATGASQFLEISTANSTEAAQASYKAAMASTRSGELPVAPGPTAAVPDGIAKTALEVFLKAGSGSPMQTVPVGPIVAPCAVRGSITISGEVTDPTTLSEGDRFAFDADNCDDGSGEIIDGGFEFVVGTFEGDFEAGLYLLTMTVTTMNFQVTTADDVVTSSGDATVTIDTRQLPLVSVSISGRRLTVDANTSTATLTDYATTQTLDTGIDPSAYTLSSSGTLDSTELAGIVSYSSPVAFAGAGADHPSTGELHVMGEKSSVRLVALDNVSVQIDTDADGDGDYESSVVMSWAEFAG